MEIQNQNNINVTQDRLDEMKATQKANQKILDDIAAQQVALSKAKADFNQQKDIETQKLNTLRNNLAKESANHQNLDTVQLQKVIDDQKDQIDALNKKIADLQEWYDKENASLKEKLAAK